MRVFRLTIDEGAAPGGPIHFDDPRALVAFLARGLAGRPLAPGEVVSYQITGCEMSPPEFLALPAWDGRAPQ